jgi:outer membrane protein TolC
MEIKKKIWIIISILFFNLYYLNAQSLDSILKLVVEKNIALKSLQSDYESAIQKANQQDQLQHPQLGVGIPILTPETRLGAQVLMVSASQMFPWFGTLKNKKKVYLELSKTKYENITALKLDLFYNVKTAYFQLIFLNEKRESVKKFKQIYKSLENFSLAKVESGKSSTADVLRIYLKLQELNQELYIITNDIRKNEIVINTITKQNLLDSIVIKKDFVYNDQLIFNIEYFEEKITNNHPLILKIISQNEASILKQKLNNKMNLPTFGIGLDYSLVNKRIDQNPDRNGNDILIPKLTMSIPIYRKIYKAKNEEEKLIQQSLEYKKEAIIDNIKNMLFQSKLNYSNALLKKELVIKQTKTIDMVYEVLLSEYSANGKGFDELLLVQNQILNFELSSSKYELEMRIAKAEIEKFTDF